MPYEQILAGAPATNAELLKAAIMRIVSDIEARLDALEQVIKPEVSDNGS